VANTLSKTTIEDGQKNLIVQVDIIGDGSGDESATLLIDVSTYGDLHGVTCSGVVLEKLQSTLEGFTARLLWDATTDVSAVFLGQGPTKLCWEAEGGRTNNAGTGKTGDLLITTTNLGSGDQGTLILEMRKLYG